MKRMGIILTLVAAVTGTSVFAQTSAPAPAAATAQTATISGQNVNVRSGPGQAYYSCLLLSAPATVQVAGETSGWLKIVPPQGAFSLVSKKYIKADGASGTITGTNVVVRAGSDLTPNRMDQIQTRANMGEKVTIMGEVGDFYKIAPPQGAYLYISAEFVKGAGGADLAASATSMPTLAGTNSPKRTLADLGVKPTPARRATSMPSLAVITEERGSFDAAEKALNEAYAKPREQRNLKGLLEQYKNIKLADNSPFKPYVDARVKFLSDEIELAQDLSTAENSIMAMEAKRAVMQTERERMKADMPNIPLRKTFVVEGELQPSGLYSGGAVGPKRYTIGNAPLVKAYVQSSSGAIDLDKYVGQYVGVSGTPKYDEKSGMYIVEADEVIIMKPGVATGSMVPSTTPPATPDVPAAKPAAKPADKAATKAADKTAPAKPADKPSAPAADSADDAPAPAPVAEPASRPAAPVNPQEYE